jgi:anaerobic dimethyl sulfoxide reductase subunit A
LWIQRELAERIGVGDKVLTRFAGVSYEDFPDAVEAACADAWEDWRKMPAPYGGADHNPPTWEEFRKHPIFMVPREDYHVFMKKNIETDAPLATDSGKIEFYSQWLANADLKTAIHHGGKCFGNGSLPPIARYRHTPEGVHSAKTKKFPMYMVTPHSLFRHHTAYDHNRWFRDEFRNSVWMSVADAKARGIKDGDQVMVHNEVGQCMMPAYVTSRMTPGVCAVLFGRWYEPSGVKTDIMPDGIDMRGDCNILIPSDFHDDVLGACLDGALVEIEKAEAKLNLERLQEV